MLEGLLPIGSVVLLKHGGMGKKIMVMGVAQSQTDNGKKLWDYCGVLFPEGFMSPDKVFMFNNEEIDRIFYIGYQDKEQFAFKIKADAAMKDLRKQEE